VGGWIILIYIRIFSTAEATDFIAYIPVQAAPASA
jgi:hypothetical protein